MIWGVTRIYDCCLAGDPPSRFKKRAECVHTCGRLLHGRELIIRRAMSDSATSFATVPLDELLAAME
jgi:predicted GH43/DUF377 family glycosyl hydrolase